MYPSISRFRFPPISGSETRDQSSRPLIQGVQKQFGLAPCCLQHGIQVFSGRAAFNGRVNSGGISEAALPRPPTWPRTAAGPGAGPAAAAAQCPESDGGYIGCNQHAGGQGFPASGCRIPGSSPRRAAGPGPLAQECTTIPTARTPCIGVNKAGVPKVDTGFTALHWPSRNICAISILHQIQEQKVHHINFRSGCSTTLFLKLIHVHAGLRTGKFGPFACEANKCCSSSV